MCIPTFSLPSYCLHHKHLYFSPSALPPCCSQLSHPHPSHASPKGESVEGWGHTSHGSLRDDFFGQAIWGSMDSTQPPACAACGPLLFSTYLINSTEIKLQVTSWEWEDSWLMCPQTVICWSLSNLQTFKKVSERGNHHLTSAPHFLSFMLLPSQGTFTSGALIPCPAQPCCYPTLLWVMNFIPQMKKYPSGQAWGNLPGATDLTSEDIGKNH